MIFKFILRRAWIKKDFIICDEKCNEALMTVNFKKILRERYGCKRQYDCKCLLREKMICNIRWWKDNFRDASGPGECARMTATHVLLIRDQPSLYVLSLSLSLSLWRMAGACLQIPDESRKLRFPAFLCYNVSARVACSYVPSSRGVYGARIYNLAEHFLQI